jgi:hypothetical protein
MVQAEPGPAPVLCRNDTSRARDALWANAPSRYSLRWRGETQKTQPGRRTINSTRARPSLCLPAGRSFNSGSTPFILSHDCSRPHDLREPGEMPSLFLPRIQCAQERVHPVPLKLGPWLLWRSSTRSQKLTSGTFQNGSVGCCWPQYFRLSITPPRNMLPPSNDSLRLYCGDLSSSSPRNFPSGVTLCPFTFVSFLMVSSFRHPAARSPVNSLGQRFCVPDVDRSKPFGGYPSQV